MIPDFPDEKQKLMEMWTKYLELKTQDLLGPFGRSPHFTNHEGHQWLLDREEKDDNETTYQDVSGNIFLKIDEAPELSPQKIMEKLDSAAEEMVNQMKRKILSDIQRASDEAGTSINANGQSLTKDLFLRMLDSMLLSFDEDGKWDPPTMIMAPELWEAKKDEMKAWENDPDFVSRQREIINRKREEWNVRESYRKLAD